MRRPRQWVIGLFDARPPSSGARDVLESVATDAESVSFDPVINAHPRLRPARPLGGLRERAYTGSRRGPHADPGALHRSS